MPVSMSEHRSLSLLPGVSGRGWSLGCRRKPALQGHMLHVPAHCPGDRGPGLGHVRDKEPAPFLSLCVCVWVGVCVCVGGWVGATQYRSTPLSLHLSMNEGVGPVVCQLSASSPTLAQPTAPPPPVLFSAASDTHPFQFPLRM